MFREVAFVAGHRWVRITVHGAGELHSVLTIESESGSEWSVDVPTWRPIGLGSGRDADYLWSARQVVRLPRAQDEEPRIAHSADEDITLVFDHDGGLVLVCETSVRRIIDGELTSRWDFCDVVASAKWVEGGLAVCDSAGNSAVLNIVGAHILQRS